MRKTGILLGLILLWCSPGPAIVISEIMYHPQADESLYEWVELYNETSARRDLSGWVFNEGIDYRFPEGTVMEPDSYLVVAADPLALRRQYDIANLFGPFGGRLDNDSDHIILRDNAGGIVAEVDYSDGGKWPVAADGAGHSLSKVNLRGDPMDPDNWAASELIGGSPGRANGSEPWYETTVLIEEGDTWRYFKGTSEASNPTDAWRQVGFDDSSWLSGPTGIGYGGGDDATVLSDMQGNYVSVFCRKTFTLSDPSTIDRLILDIDHDDGFIAYLNGVEMGRGAYSLLMPSTYNTVAFNHPATVDGGSLTVLNLTPYLHLLGATNVLAVQVHNSSLLGDDLSFIPRLKAQTLRLPQQLTMPVVLNEVLFNTSDTQYIELYNRSASPVDVGNYCLSNDPDNLQRFVIPSPTVVPGHGRAVFIQSQLGFSMTAAGDRVLFSDGASGIVIDGRAVEPGPRDMSEGRWPDGADSWFYMNLTSGTANTVSLNTSVVINEIMYHPPTDDDRDEYIELYNAGTATVDLTGWRFSRGIQFEFPTGASIDPGQYLIIAKDRARMTSRYGLSPFIVMGDYLGRLADGGEKIRLRDANNNVADEVHYFDGGHWPEWADGQGSSLELIDPRQDNANYQAWAPSDETGKAQWTPFSYSGPVRTRADSNEHELHLHLLDAGEVLVDDIQLTRGATNHIPNGGFESGVGSWVILGNHIQSHVTSEDAFSGIRCLKIVATGGGDTGANHIEQDASPSMSNGATYTISFQAKWLWGNNLLVTRCFDNQLPETHRLPIPDTTGTPGAVNSVYQANLGPVISDVAHEPVVPISSAAVTVRATAHDPDGVVLATVFYKTDADAIYASSALSDDGFTNGDEVAGDGVYTGQIPPQAAGQTVAFYLQATDGAGKTNTWPTDTSRPALYRVESGTWSSNFPTYRVVMTADDLEEMFLRPHLSNEALNCTFIFNETDVYYNCGIRFTGSPYGRRGSGWSAGYRGFKVAFNADEKLHGVKWQARFDSGQNGGYRDRLSYDLLRVMGEPTCQLEWFAVRVNDRNEGIMEDTLPPGKRYLDIFYRGEDDANLFEISNYYGYTDNNDFFPSNFYRGETTFRDWGNDKDQYRWNFRLRNHKGADDFDAVISMVKALANSPDSTYEADIAQVIDVQQWTRQMAVRSVINDWDFLGTEQSKNAYIYAPPNKKWQLLPWDCELAFGTSRYDRSLYCYGPSAPVILRFQQFGGHRHYFLNYVHKFMKDYFNHAHMDPLIDHYYSLVRGQSASQTKSFIDSRRSWVQPYLDPYLPPRVILTLTTADPLTVLRLEALLQGTAPVYASWVRCRGYDYWLEWTDATHWYVTIDVPAGSNLVTLEFLDYNKDLIGTKTIMVHAPGQSAVKSWMRYDTR